VHYHKFNRDRPIHLPKPPPHLHPNALAFRFSLLDLDHYNGITQSWDYGTIYASEITKKLMMTKYPKLRDKVGVIPYGSWHSIDINEETVRVMAIDSNHMAGSIMVMINYRQKYYLHTGDMRFNKKIV
jgi:DNA cross-link repair 1A protein